MACLRTLLGLSVLASVLLASGGAVAQTSCVITCPANVTLATAPGESSVAYSYALPTATCGGVVQTSGLPPTGAKWYVGVTNNGWQAINDAQATCSFTVTVTATPAVAEPAAAIPALAPVVLGLLAVLLAGGGGLAARRRSTRRSRSALAGRLIGLSSRHACRGRPLSRRSRRDARHLRQQSVSSPAPARPRRARGPPSSPRRSATRRCRRAAR